MRRATPALRDAGRRAPRTGVRSCLPRIMRLAAPVALLALTGACVATRQDVQLLQNDIATMRAEQTARDSLRSAQLERVVATMGAISDSLRIVSTRLASFQGDVKGDLFTTNQQLLQIQELTGQSQRRLLELRAGLEERAGNAAPPAAAPAPSTSPSGPVGPPTGGATPGSATAQPAVVATVPAGPGPNQLFQLSLDQLRRGSAGAARAGFLDLLRQYPTSDLAGDAQFYLAESYAAEGNAVLADSAYGNVVARHPTSARVPTAMYKRAVAAQAANRTAEARSLFEAVVSGHPRSDEAELARERLRTLPR